MFPSPTPLLPVTPKALSYECLTVHVEYRAYKPPADLLRISQTKITAMMPRVVVSPRGDISCVSVRDLCAGVHASRVGTLDTSQLVSHEPFQ
jgi:hypothetical protein